MGFPHSDGVKLQSFRSTWRKCKSFKQRRAVINFSPELKWGPFYLGRFVIMTFWKTDFTHVLFAKVCSTDDKSHDLNRETA